MQAAPQTIIAEEFSIFYPRLSASLKPRKKKKKGRQTGGKAATTTMSNSGGESPDWLRSFQAPEKSFLALSSDSDPSTNDNSGREDDNHIEEPTVYSPSKLPKEEKNQDAVLIDSGDDSPVKKPPKSKSPKKRVKVESKRLKEDKEDDVEAVKEEISEKPAEPNVSSRMPLLMPEKVQRSKALVECEGDIDMSGDVGAVGRFVVSDTASGNHEVLLDLKGTIYKTTIVPSRTFCIVNFGPTEAKIEAVMNDFIQLKPHSNVYESETMVEGTLEGFSFDSDEEADKNPKANGQGNEAEDGNETGEQTNKKIKGKDKSLGVSRKKGKIAGKAPPKKARKKTQVAKKSKGAKK